VEDNQSKLLSDDMPSICVDIPFRFKSDKCNGKKRWSRLLAHRKARQQLEDIKRSPSDHMMETEIKSNKILSG
jgi:hypothetical protein